MSEIMEQMKKRIVALELELADVKAQQKLDEKLWQRLVMSMDTADTAEKTGE